MWLDRLGFYGLPVIATALLHLLLVALLTLRWPTDTTVIAAAPKARIIQASLVDAATLKPKKRPRQTPTSEKNQPKPRQSSPPKPKPKPVAQSTPEPVTAPPVKPKVTPTPKSEPEKKPEVDQGERLRDEVLAGMTSSPDLPGSVDEPSARDAAVALIQRAVMSRWTRPPSARNGMVAILTIQLVPTGDVVGVNVLESSGNAAFDRSAMTAVQRAGRFPEIAQLERDMFEREFRSFQLIFRPEDLRY